MAEPRPVTLGEVVIWPARPGEFAAGNPAARSWVVGDLAFLELLSALRSADAPLPPGPFRAVDATVSPYRDGLLGDPTGLDRDKVLDGVSGLDAEGAIALARRCALVADDPRAFADSLQPRRNVLDRGRAGSIHQQVGEHVLLELRRASVDDWWADQKFTEDRRQPREGLYRSVQWPFMDAYFDEERLSGNEILDFGCGPGLFTRLFASRGARVLAMDTSAEHLRTTRALADADGVGEQVLTSELRLPVEEGLATIGDRRFDLIFLSDVLMFYFVPYDLALKLDPHALLRGLAGLLAPGGRIAVLEPDGTHWQRPWLGDPERPYTILTDQRTRRTRVTPSLEEVSRAAEAAGLAIHRVRQLTPPDPRPDDRGEAFAAEFPLWWYFELGRAGTAS